MRRPGYLAGWQAMKPRTFGDFGGRRGLHGHRFRHYRTPDLLQPQSQSQPQIIVLDKGNSGITAYHDLVASPPPAPIGPAGGFSKGAR